MKSIGNKSKVSFLRYLIVTLTVSGGLLASNLTVFAATPVVTSAKITGPNTVVLQFSEPVITSLSDYQYFTGNLAGRNITAISGSGTSVVTLYFDGSSFTAGAAGGLTISTNTKSISDSSPFVNGAISVTNGLPPALALFSVSSNGYNNLFMGSGVVLNFSFTTNESVVNPSLNVNGKVLSLYGNGNGPYTGSYTMTGSEVSPLPVTISFTDNSGNTGTVSMTLGNTVSVAVVLSSVTSNATASGSLKVGDTIIFTLTPSLAVPGGTVYGQYNGVPLVWTTSNGGQSYTATYTVSAGDSDQATPLQISGVTLTNANGVTSTPISGTDVAKTIHTHGPMLTETTPVPAYSTTVSPAYTFTSTEAGTITYYGDCSSNITQAVFGQNTIVLNPLSNGLHSNCLLSVTDSAGNISNRVPIDPFTVNVAGNTNVLSQTAAQSSTGSGTASPHSSYKFNKPLSYGSVGTDVIELQKRLAREGVYSGPTTGYYGSLTVAAVKKYQKIHGLSQLGNVGPGTRAELNQ